MSGSYHIDGECQIKVGTGASAALEVLGVSVDGVDIELQDHTERIDIDTLGGPAGPPGDEQAFPQTGLVHAQLIWWDQAVLRRVRSRVGGSSAAIAAGTVADGAQPASGTLHRGGGLYFRLLLTSNDEPWNFLLARVLNNQAHRSGTRARPWDLNFYCVPFMNTAIGNTYYDGNSASASSAILFNRSTS